MELPLALGSGAVLPVQYDDVELDTPALLVDLDVVEANIARMQAFADHEGVHLRPHVKSHKSLEVARRQLAAGAHGLCVATASEAQLMQASTARDILIAYPLLGERKMARLEQLSAEDRLTLVTDSFGVTDGYRHFAKRGGAPLRVLVEIDTGMHRAGVDPRRAVEVALDVARSDRLQFGGILTHAGHAHDAPDHRGVAHIARAEAATMGAVREELENAGLEVATVSAGSTITAPYLRRSDGITEIRPGTYVYNDLRTLSRFACTPNMIAASMLTTVVSVAGDRVTLDAGSKTLTTTVDQEHGHGYPVDRPDARFTRMSEEHGVLTVPEVAGFRSPVVGDRMRVLPIHVCVWIDLQSEIYGTRRGLITERIRVEGMRHSL